MKLSKFVFFLFFAVTASGQEITPGTLGFKAYSIENETLGKVDYYITQDYENKPLLVYLDGSGAFPLFQKVNQGIGSTVVIDFQTLRRDYAILLISKPGVPFVDTVEMGVNGIPEYPAPAEYKRRLTLDWRVNSADMIINKLIQDSFQFSDRIIVLGFSEGAQVASHLAIKNRHVTHLMLFGGNGLNQLFDPIVSARMNAKAGKISEQEAQRTVDSLFVQYEEIYKDPRNTKKEWWGHSYARWGSFGQRDPLNALLDIQIPIYMAKGSLDDNTVLSADYIKLEFIRKGKENLTYRTYPNLDHQFNEIHYKDEGFVNSIPKIQSVMAEAFEWLETN